MEFWFEFFRNKENKITSSLFEKAKEQQFFSVSMDDIELWTSLLYNHSFVSELEKDLAEVISMRLFQEYLTSINLSSLVDATVKIVEKKENLVSFPTCFFLIECTARYVAEEGTEKMKEMLLSTLGMFVQNRLFLEKGEKLFDSLRIVSQSKAKGLWHSNDLEYFLKSRNVDEKVYIYQWAIISNFLPSITGILPSRGNLLSLYLSLRPMNSREEEKVLRRIVRNCNEYIATCQIGLDEIEVINRFEITNLYYTLQATFSGMEELLQTFVETGFQKLLSKRYLAPFQMINEDAINFVADIEEDFVDYPVIVKRQNTLSYESFPREVSKPQTVIRDAFGRIVESEDLEF